MLSTLLLASYNLNHKIICCLYYLITQLALAGAKDVRQSRARYRERFTFKASMLFPFKVNQFCKRAMVTEDTTRYLICHIPIRPFKGGNGYV